MSNSDNGNKDATTGGLYCDNIRPVLFDYMARELGQARSELVREHLRKCPVCQKEAAEIQATLDLLKATPETTRIRHLSEDRRRRVIRAYMHPVIDWIYTHHILVSGIAAFIIVAAIFCILLKTRIWSEMPEPGIPVTIGHRQTTQTSTNALPSRDAQH